MNTFFHYFCFEIRRHWHRPLHENRTPNIYTLQWNGIYNLNVCRCYHRGPNVNNADTFYMYSINGRFVIYKQLNQHFKCFCYYFIILLMLILCYLGSHGKHTSLAFSKICKLSNPNAIDMSYTTNALDNHKCVRHS